MKCVKPLIGGIHLPNYRRQQTRKDGLLLNGAPPTHRAFVYSRFTHSNTTFSLVVVVGTVRLNFASRHEIEARNSRPIKSCGAMTAVSREIALDRVVKIR